MIEKLRNFLVSSGLYAELDISIDDVTDLSNFLENEFTMDAFCPECGNMSTFKWSNAIQPRKIGGGTNPANRTLIPDDAEIAALGYKILIGRHRHIEKVFECARNPKHELRFVLALFEDKIIKYGQLPSSADLQLEGAKKYRKLLGGYSSEFSKAIGLYSHGVGVGSFVYLRRIFEHLIEEAKVKSRLGESEFVNKRMDEKISILKDHLPEILVANKSMYGVISKGIHELSEEECKNIFPVVKLGIELILDEELERREKEEKARAFQQSLAEISARHKN